MEATEPGPTPGQRLAAASVHLYTATGSVLALLMVHYSYRGEVETVLWLFLAAMVVDGTDGMLARRFHVKRVMPSFDGALLDNIVDYMTYTLAPMALLWSNGYLPSGVLGGILACAPLLASCYQFCRSDAKTDDHFFLGFPSYWNILAFYVIATGLGTTVTAWMIVVLVILVFVPIKYVYPSRTEPMWQLTFLLTGLWFVAYAVDRGRLPRPQRAGRGRVGRLPRLLHRAEPLPHLAVPAPRRQGRCRRCVRHPLGGYRTSTPGRQTADDHRCTDLEEDLMTTTPDEPLNDDDITTGAAGGGLEPGGDADGTDGGDADGTDGDSTDSTDGDSGDADGTDGGDADGTDA